MAAQKEYPRFTKERNFWAILIGSLTFDDPDTVVTPADTDFDDITVEGVDFITDGFAADDYLIIEKDLNGALTYTCLTKEGFALLDPKLQNGQSIRN